MKKIKHFLGWLFGFCPYGNGCKPSQWKMPKGVRRDDSISGGGC